MLVKIILRSSAAICRMTHTHGSHFRANIIRPNQL